MFKTLTTIVLAATVLATTAHAQYPQGLNAAIAFATPAMTPPPTGTQMLSPDNWQTQYNEFISGKTPGSSSVILDSLIVRGLHDFDRELSLHWLYLWRTTGEFPQKNQDKQWEEEFSKRQTQYTRDFTNRPMGSPPPPAAATRQEYQAWRDQIRGNWQAPPGLIGARWYVPPGFEQENAKFWRGIFSSPGEYSYSD
jgi:hypothetical protein